MTRSQHSNRTARPGPRSSTRFAALRSAYRATALIVLNALILLALLELAMSVAVSVARREPARGWIATITGRPNDVIAHYRELSYYTAQPWSERYWDEHGAALAQAYRPYVVWRSPAFAGELLNIDGEGRRATPGAPCAPGSYEVWTFGGSSMWGWGAPDWGTIPAYLKEALESRRAADVCVVNLAENAFVSTQALVQLLLELQRGGRPELVLFYDGVNEVLAASQSGRAAVHQNLAEIAARYEARPVTFGAALRQTNTAQVVGWLARNAFGGRPRPVGEPTAATEELAADVVGAYLSNLASAESLAAAFGFELRFFWQPHILVGDRTLEGEELALVNGLDWVLELTPERVALFEAVYGRIARAALEEPRLHDLSGAFDDLDETIWIDTWGHVTPAGNRAVARAIAAQLERPLPQR